MALKIKGQTNGRNFIMIISTISENGKSVSLSFGKLDVDTGEIEFEVVISVPGNYKRLSFSSFKQAADIYRDMKAQYFN
jgi:hypothetical protein